MNKIPLLLFALVCISFNLLGQDFTYQKTKYTGEKINTFNPKNYEPGFSVKLKNLEAPKPGGDSYRSYLMKVKSESAKKFPRTTGNSSKSGPVESDSLVLLRSVGMNRYIKALDTIVPIDPPSAPLDNTIAVSNDEIIVGSVNSLVYAYDLKTDSILYDFNNRDYIELDDFAKPIATNAPFDPKLLYDPQEDRFILVYLSGRNPGNSRIIVAFSTTNDPTDEWNVYWLTGNPLKNNTWTDYPAIALTDKELFLTINLLRPGEPWQTGFAGSIIWQIDKYSGYEGLDSLNTSFYGDIRHNGRLIRNLNPIQGGREILGPNMYLISNRNFDIQNDSIFLLEVTNTMDSPDAKLKIKVGITSEPYGVPPNGEQANATPVTDSTGFDTNDGRVLGGFLHNDRIQFVANTKDFTTGLAAVYHGFIDSLKSEDLKITGTIIGDPVLDFGYPNIAYSGKTGCDNEAVIGFNHTSKDVFAGFSAIHYNNNNGYSSVIRLKEGLNYVDDINGPYERWGDYFGIQRIYNEPGKIWTAGFYGNITKGSATWFAEIESPDSLILSLTVDTNILSLNNCDGQISFEVNNGKEPYIYLWNDAETSSTSFNINSCEGEYKFVVQDAQGCKISSQNFFDAASSDYTLYPNPSTGDVNLKFELDKEQKVQIRIHDLTGKLIAELLDQTVKKGLNAFSFSTLPLAKGYYVFSVYADDKELFTEKLIKQ